MKFKAGDIVKFDPKWSNPGEEFYIHMVKGPYDASVKNRYMIETLNTLIALGSTEVVDEEMIQKANKYEVILSRNNTKNRGYLVTDTETKTFFAGYDFMGSVDWVSEAEATEMSLEEAKQIASDLTAGE
jgi:hypothetical protein